MIEFSGVRSSCDMLARNWFFERSAAMQAEVRLAQLVGPLHDALLRARR